MTPPVTVMLPILGLSLIEELCCKTSLTVFTENTVTKYLTLLSLKERGFLIEQAKLLN
jgi:hypothetical protein